MRNAWGRPSVRGELHGQRDPRAERAAAQKQAEAARPAAEEEDPYWQYFNTYNR